MTAKRKRRPTLLKRLSNVEVCVTNLHDRLRAVERIHDRRRIGFETECVGDRIEQDDDDDEVVPEET